MLDSPFLVEKYGIVSKVLAGTLEMVYLAKLDGSTITRTYWESWKWTRQECQNVYLSNPFKTLSISSTRNPRVFPHIGFVGFQVRRLKTRQYTTGCGNCKQQIMRWWDSSKCELSTIEQLTCLTSPHITTIAPLKIHGLIHGLLSFLNAEQIGSDPAWASGPEVPYFT